MCLLVAMATAVIICEGYLPLFSFIFIPFHLTIIYFNLFSSFYHLISTSGHNFLPLFFLLFFLLSCHTSSILGHLSLLFNSLFPPLFYSFLSFCRSPHFCPPCFPPCYFTLSFFFPLLLLLFTFPFLLLILIFSYFPTPFPFPLSYIHSPLLFHFLLYSPLSQFFLLFLPHDFHPPLSTPYPIIFPLCSSSPPLSISVITQFSRVFPFQILSPCITSDLQLGVPVYYLCALVSICARSCLPPPHSQIAAKGSGINIQALQAFGAGDVW